MGYQPRPRFERSEDRLLREDPHLWMEREVRLRREASERESRYMLGIALFFVLIMLAWANGETVLRHMAPSPGYTTGDTF